MAATWAFAQETQPSLRLPDAARPVRYAAELEIKPAEASFRGTLDIEVEVRRSTPVLWLNARFLTIQKATSGNQAAAVVPGGDDFIGLRFDPPLPAGSATLHIEYVGQLSERDTAGAFRQREGRDWYVYTQLESIFARRVFPCFDEPGYKVPWQLSLVVAREHLAVSNTPIASETDLPNGMKKVTFAQTPPLPSYLIAFGVGPFEAVDAGKAGRKNTPLRIIVPHGMKAQAAYAAKVTPRLLALAEEYTGIPYPYEKLDSLALLLRGQFGAMENAGLITYAMPLILARPQDETPRFRQNYAHVAAHEIAHMWFGDLVTHAWWDDIWLNESFATWMADKVIDRFEPAWNIHAKSVHERNWAMKNDALVSARRIRQPIESNNDIFNAFDGITYAKGGAVLGMFERWMGPERFRLALQRYLGRYADGNATSAEFLAQLSAVEPAAGEAFATFLDQAGTPLLSVELRCTPSNARLWLEQKRYLPLGSTGSNAQVWQIPFCVRYGTRGGSRSVCALLGAEIMDLPLGETCPAWVRAEPSRYYRVAYRGRADLASPTLPVPLVDRVAAIGDIDALARNGNLALGTALERLEASAALRNRDVAQAVIWTLGDLRPLLPDELHANWQRWVQKLFAKQAQALGFVPRAQDNDDTLRLRPALIAFLASDGNDPALRSQATDLALLWLEDRSAIPDSNLAEVVVQAAARNGDRELFDRLRRAVAATQDRRERRILYIALGSFADPGIARSALAMILEPIHDYRESMQIAWTMSDLPRGGALAYAFMKANFDTLASMAPLDAPAYYPRMAGTFCSAEQRADVESFFRERSPRFTGGPRILAQTLERINLCASLRQKQQASFATFLRKY